MNRRRIGDYVTTSTVGGTVKAFVPAPLPPAPGLEMNEPLQELYDQSLLSLGRLDSLSTILPDTDLFIYMYVRKEAVLSSQIEGTQSSLAEFLQFENETVPGAPLEDVVEVSNYVAAMDHGLSRLKEGFPLSLRLFREIHEILLREGRGSHQTPGEFRRSQNWVGGSRPGDAVFVPPPPEMVVKLMGDLELFLHNKPRRLPTLIKAALAHVQFESIHPFLDGNGRLGRLLITLLFCLEGLLKQPLLYLSLYLKRHRQEYYDLLQRVRLEGDWEAWVAFFLEGVVEVAGQAVETAQRLRDLFDDDRRLIQERRLAVGSALRVHRALQEKPLMSIGNLSNLTRLHFTTVQKALNNLTKLGLVREITGRERGKLFVYERYLNILNEGTELP